MTRDLAALLLLTLIPIAAMGEETYDAKRHGDDGNIFTQFIDYLDESNKPKPYKRFDFSVLGGPSYSSDKGFGIGIVAACQYRMQDADSLLQPSMASIFANATTELCFQIGIGGCNIFPQDKMRLEYEFSFASYRSYYWGIGYDMGANDDNKSRYKYFETSADVDLGFRLAPHLYLGPEISMSYIEGRKSSYPELWWGIPKHTFSLGAGLVLKYDSRDFITGPTTGAYACLKQLFYPSFAGNKYAFINTQITGAYYHRMWKNAVGAVKFDGNFTFGDTPWGLMPTFGGSSNMRGYYKGQYRDKCAMTACAEIRQYVWNRFGIVAWGGAGKVFPGLKHFKFNHILPNYGIGIRWEFKKHVNVRLDYGFGRHCSGFVFNINEAF